MLLFPNNGECPHCGCIAWIRYDDSMLYYQCGEEFGFQNEVLDNFAGEVLDLEDLD